MCIRRCVGCVDLARYPWIDFDWPTPASRDESRPSLAAILAQLRDTAHARVTAVLRVGGAGLFAMAGGPWLAWLPIELLGRLPGRLVRPLPVDIGRYRYRTGFVARRAAEDLAVDRRRMLTPHNRANPTR